MSGIITKNCGTALDHCVQITGWNTQDNVEYWVVRNSWVRGAYRPPARHAAQGESWGNKGYIYVEMFKNLCGIAQEATTATL